MQAVRKITKKQQQMNHELIQHLLRVNHKQYTGQHHCRHGNIKDVRPQFCGSAHLCCCQLYQSRRLCFVFNTRVALRRAEGVICLAGSRKEILLSLGKVQLYFSFCIAKIYWTVKHTQNTHKLT